MPSSLQAQPSPVEKGAASFRTRIQKIAPPDRTYTPLKLRRRNFLLALLIISVSLLTLILGLAVGLSLRDRRGTPTLPLPSGSDIYQGDLTYYDPGLGACGFTSTDSDDVVAIAHALFDSQSMGSDPNSNLLCGRMLRAEHFDDRIGQNATIDLKVVDRCVGCQPTDLDVSPSAFARLADLSLGRVEVWWAWI